MPTVKEQIATLDSILSQAHQDSVDIMGKVQQYTYSHRMQEGSQIRGNARRRAAELAERYVRGRMADVQRAESREYAIQREYEDSLDPSRMQVAFMQAQALCSSARDWAAVEAFFKEGSGLKDVHRLRALKEVGLPAARSRQPEAWDATFGSKRPTAGDFAELEGAVDLILEELEPSNLQRARRARSDAVLAVRDLVDSLQSLQLRYSSAHGGDPGLQEAINLVDVHLHTQPDGSGIIVEVNWAQEPEISSPPQFDDEPATAGVTG